MIDYKFGKAQARKLAGVPVPPIFSMKMEMSRPTPVVQIALRPRPRPIQPTVIRPIGNVFFF